ncbi:maleylpyruvate isomerase family mycothiol-dependent enzyme [Streptomyces sp. NPDC054863]
MDTITALVREWAVEGAASVWHAVPQQSVCCVLLVVAVVRAVADKQVAMRLAEQLVAAPAETLERFRRVVLSTTKPPLPAVAMLGETLVHGADVRRPLGIGRDCPVEVVTAVADYYRGSNLVVLAKGRIGGLRLVTQDGPLTAGSGPLVSGTTSALVMAMTGRSAYRDDLEGEGVELLRSRCGTA